MPNLPFKKMHGLGNCFVIMDDRQGQVRAEAAVGELAMSVCDRDFGIGADGLILVREHKSVPFEMIIINEDGTMAEMCGNGIRCFTKFVIDQGFTGQKQLDIQTGAGLIRTQLLDDGQVEVDMGEPSLRSDDVIATGETPLAVVAEDREFTFVSMGNPHAITVVDNFDFDWELVGQEVEYNRAFPRRTNVEFVQPVSPTEIEIRVWERGCGVTQACGTGACASVVAAVLKGHIKRELITARLPGGPLKIHWTEQGRVMMTGPAETVCTGTYHW